MLESTSSNGADTMGLLGSLIVLIVGLGFYLFYCYCCKLICQKAGHEPGILIWIPIANLIPLLTVSKLPIWTIILFLVPLVNVILGFVLWFKICEARGKSGWLVILLLVPIVNLAFIPYLAFTE